MAAVGAGNLCRFNKVVWKKAVARRGSSSGRLNEVPFPAVLSSGQAGIYAGRRVFQRDEK
jgi:hypothetical protein